MKVFVCLFALIAAANAVPVALAPAHLSTGSSTQSRSQDAAGNYAFAYNEQHATGGSSRKEQGNPAGVVGSYSLNVADGRQRVVKYVADGLGFRAAIATNEPGTAAAPAAATSIASPYAPPAPVAPLAIAAAPVAIAAAPAYAAPLAYGPGPLAGPVLAHGPAVVGHAPIAVAPAVSAYSSAVNHVAGHALAAPAVLAAPVHKALW